MCRIASQLVDPAKGQDRIVTKSRFGFPMMFPRIGTEFYLYGDMEPDNCEFLRAIARQADMFLDVGAGLGFYVLLAGHEAKHHIDLMALEPMSGNYEGLKENLRLNKLDSVPTQNVAVSSTAREVTFEYFAAHTFAAATVPGTLKEGVEKITVPAIPVDDLLPHLRGHKRSIILMDIEGSEYAALSGMQRVLADIRPLLLLELHPRMLEAMGVNPGDPIRLLSSTDYQCFIISKGGKTLQAFGPESWKTSPFIHNWVVAVPQGNSDWPRALQQASVSMPKTDPSPMVA
jgi:FkbM family methyltransferase